MCVFDGVSTGGTFNLIVLPELGSFTSRHTRKKNSGGLIGKFAGKNCCACDFPYSAFSFVKKYLILYYELALFNYHKSDLRELVLLGITSREAVFEKIIH